MALQYAPEVRDRLLEWKVSDGTLYGATAFQLEGIREHPHQHGRAGTPLVERLVAYPVAGRDDEYVITWRTEGDDAFILSVSSTSELIQRSKLNR